MVVYRAGSASGVLMHGWRGGGRRAGIYCLNVIIFDVSRIANILVGEHRWVTKDVLMI